MAGRPFLPDLVPCREDSGVQLEQVGGARVDLLQWQSQASNEQVALPVYTDRWLSSNTCGSIEQVVVHVHGKERDADIAWADIAAARGRLSVDQQKKTLLVVPQFLNGLDKSKYQPANQDLLLVWKGNGWGEGSPSVRPKASVSNDNTGISSFEALDAILSHFANRQMYHGVERIVFCKHPAANHKPAAKHKPPRYEN
uniref:Uncharacterized protein n=1 Tax=Kalmanozyma brasiliensis (strain GHG001) TaxID=1365824 RepID=V5EXU0_KALBG